MRVPRVAVIMAVTGAKTMGMLVRRIVGMGAMIVRMIVPMGMLVHLYYSTHMSRGMQPAEDGYWGV